MRMLKRRLAMLLAAAMLFTSLPVMNVAAAEDGAPAVENTADGGEEKNEAPAEENKEPAPAEENDNPAPAEENNNPAQEGENNNPAQEGENTDPAQEGENNEPAPQEENNDVVTPEAEDVSDTLEEGVSDDADDAVVKPSSLKIQLKGADIPEEGTKVNVGSTITLTAVAEPETADASVVWSTSDKSVATVTENGVVKGVTGGTVTITAKSAADESIYAEVTVKSFAGTWVKSGKKWKFKRPNGKFASNAFITIDGLTYYIGSDKYMKTGWFKVSKKNYYANSKGEIQKGWLKLTVKEKIKGKKKSVVRYWYMNPTTGVRTTGWKKIDGKFYYFGSDGKNQKSTGWAKISKVWYYMEKDEDNHIYAVTGWKQIKDKWYYLEPSDKLHGKMKTGWFTETVTSTTSAAAAAAAEDAENEEAVEAELELATADTAEESGGSTTKTYYFNSSGASVTGVQTINKKKYLFVKESDGKGVLADDGWTNIGKDWYYVNPETHVVATGRTEIDGKTYYFDTKSGIARTGVVNLSTTKTTGSGKKKKTTTTYKFYYYMDDGTGKGVLQTGTWVDDGDNHYYAGPLNDVNADGMLMSGSQEIDGKYYYFDAKSGKAKSGIITVGSSTYLYLAEGEHGRPARYTETGKVEYNGKPYFIDENGALAKNRFVKDGEDYYYYNNDYQIATGWVKLDKKVDNSKIYKSDNKTVDKKWYYFDPDTGKMKTGWLEYKEKMCYLDPETGIMVTGKKKIGSDTYYFSSDGYMQHGAVGIGGKYYAFDLDTGKLVLGQTTWTDDAGNSWKLNSETGEITNYSKNLGNMDTKAQSAGSSSNWLIMANKSTHIMGVYQKSGGRWVRQKTWAFHSADNKKDAKTGQKHWTPEMKSYVQKSIDARMSNKKIGTDGVIQRDFDGSTGYYCTYIHAGYFIHTRLYPKGSRLKTADYYKYDKKPWRDGRQRNPVDPGLKDSKAAAGSSSNGGGNYSHGCVRLNFNNALWVFTNIPGNTRVWTYH